MQTRYGIASCLNGSLTRAELFAAVAEAGFKHVELSSDRGHLEDWVSHPEATRRELEKNGLQALSVHTPEAGWKSNAPDEQVRRASVDAAASCFEPARIVGAGVIIIHPTTSDFEYKAGNLEGHRSRARRSLGELAERAGRLGLRLAAENLPARGTCRPGVRIGEVLEMIRGLGDHVGLCLDAGHANSNGLEPAAEARVAGSRLFAVHIQDNDGKGEDMHLLPGAGTTDWERFIRALDEIGFSGGRIFEVPQVAEGHIRTLSLVADLVRRWDRLRA
jgi:sugar phosphate isomerase/epimerase